MPPNLLCWVCILFLYFMVTFLLPLDQPAGQACQLQHPCTSISPQRHFHNPASSTVGYLCLIGWKLGPVETNLWHYVMTAVHGGFPHLFGLILSCYMTLPHGGDSHRSDGQKLLKFHLRAVWC